jgi:prepilin-type N-terminal cleavage/methylation domain-containing protein
MRKNERGYSLVEVLVAMAILGTVLMSIITLFIFGRRNVHSGRQMTRATSVATHVIEDIGPLTAEQFYTTFKIVDTTVIPASATVANMTYTDAITRRLGDFAAGEPGFVYFDRWAQLIPAAQMTRGRVTLVIMPRDMPPATPNNPTTSRRLLVRAVTEWEEAARPRQVFIDTVKLNRNF